jgi:hypothetical protein
VTNPLVYLFAAAAVVIALWFALAAFLSYVHASTRRARADELGDYLAVPRGPAAAEARSTGEARTRVMHISIGDLVRDPAVADAAARGLAGRSQPPGAAP